MPNETSLASKSLSSTDTTSSRSVTCLLQPFSAFFYFINWSWIKRSPLCIVHTLCQFKPQWKMAAFHKTIATIGQAMSSWPIMKSHPDNAWEIFFAPVVKNASSSHFLQMDRCSSLPFMRPIKTFHRISAIPQPRSNTVIYSQLEEAEGYSSWCQLRKSLEDACKKRLQTLYSMHQKWLASWKSWILADKLQTQPAATKP